MNYTYQFCFVTDNSISLEKSQASFQVLLEKESGYCIDLDTLKKYNFVEKVSAHQYHEQENVFTLTPDFESMRAMERIKNWTEINHPELII